MKLEWAPMQYQAFAAENPELTLCRISAQEKGQYRLIDAAGERQAVVSGKFQYTVKTVSDYPAVGDYVMAQVRGDDTAVIHRLLPRKSVFLRKAAGTAQNEQVVAANIDTVLICMALNHDFNLRRLERYLSVAWDSGAMPVVVLTKSDLCSDTEEKRLAAEGVAVGVDVLVTSSVIGEGYTPVLPYTENGRTVALVGSSGAGKSTLINCLLGEERMKTGGLRNDDKGRHTTTHRELLQLPSGGVVIDTPGMRELGMWDTGEGVAAAFSDVEALAAQCRFRNCTHQAEPGCAVRTALTSGQLSEERFLSYQKLTAENAYQADSGSYLAEKEKKFKEIAKRNKCNRKRGK